jgi:hypothetical protein
VAVSVNTSGSQAATITTEHDLATVTTAGVFVLAVDCNAMTNGTTPDIVELTIYGKARSSDSTRRVAVYTLIGQQTIGVMFLSVPYVSPHFFKATLKQTQGTGRTYPWAIYGT